MQISFGLQKEKKKNNYIDSIKKNSWVTALFFLFLPMIKMCYHTTYEYFNFYCDFVGVGCVS